MPNSREHLVPLDTFQPLPSQIQFIDSDDWEKIVHEKSNQAFDCEGQIPCWEVVLIRRGSWKREPKQTAADATLGYLL
jgi:hypothetical protein